MQKKLQARIKGRAKTAVGLDMQDFREKGSPQLMIASTQEELATKLF